VLSIFTATLNWYNRLFCIFPFLPAEGLPVTGCHNAFCRIALIAAGNHVIAVKWRFCHVIFTIRYVSSSGFSDKLCVSISDISRFLFSSPWKAKGQEHFPRNLPCESVDSPSLYLPLRRPVVGSGIPVSRVHSVNMLGLGLPDGRALCSEYL
jgi:hypothetical protein